MLKKRILSLFLIVTLLCSLAACQKAPSQESSEHKIAVLVYDLQDEQVQAFREYLEGYIALSFPDVSFLYSSAITDADAEMEFLKNAIDQGAEGILSFNSYDLEAEVNLCREHGVYYIRPSSTVAKEDFDKVKDNPYFLGYFGPGEEEEYQAGYDMAAWFAEKQMSDSYFVVTGGAGMGNIMHSQRTQGILDALQKHYGVTFSADSATLSAVSETTTVEAGFLKVTLFPGYVGMPAVGDQAVTAYESANAGVVLGVIPLRSIADGLGSARLGIIDCYTASNGDLFKEGKLCYLTGKYESIIAPAFAALYNAIGGYADSFRDHGQAFALNQGFWTSKSYGDFLDKYALSSGIALNAYSVEDILGVCKAYNENAGFDDLKALADGWDFDSAAQRRK